MTITKKVNRSVKIGGGLIVLGVVVGTFLSQYLPNFGGGDGVLPGTAPNERLAEKSAEQPEQPAEINPETLLGYEKVLRIAIQGRTYLLDTGSAPSLKELTLEQVVKLAQAAPGDENGIRVYVRREQSARAKAEEDLETALLDAGFTPNSIVGLEDTRP